MSNFEKTLAKMSEAVTVLSSNSDILFNISVSRSMLSKETLMVSIQASLTVDSAPDKYLKKIICLHHDIEELGFGNITLTSNQDSGMLHAYMAIA